MNIDDIKGKKFKVMRDIVAVTWKKPKLKSGIVLPDSVTNTRFEAGRYFAAKVFAVGPKVTGIAPDDWVIVHEYSPLNLKGDWMEDKIYFIEQKSIPAKLDNWDGNQSMIERKVEEGALEERNRRSN